MNRTHPDPHPSPEQAEAAAIVAENRGAAVRTVEKLKQVLAGQEHFV